MTITESILPQEESKQSLAVSGVTPLALLVHSSLRNNIPEPISADFLWKSVTSAAVNNSLHSPLSAAQEDAAEPKQGTVTV